ncbi:DUF3006 domain-containing protein [Desulfitobacterium chlororespirans]|uniref:DUF3006 domain-containing protein n=1 Tax=Desulfitobacterium chlororespirans DSM 11544 TaxID=1121395 RepID=A0A1M7SZV6_9FIRM|nr:DUF3006 domain-containing protein [Desulfitobacterium chlororespirans]SHN63964.1 Protein of unknown function [Desulfitobacterium chlororespirans DSM 11544]
MKGIIDRFEGEFAVVEQEDRVIINVPRHVLPREAKEGDILILSNGEYQIDPSETAKRKKRIEELSRELWE